jgi:hypothetical protein
MYGRGNGRYRRKLLHMGATIDHVGIPATDPEAARTDVPTTHSVGQAAPTSGILTGTSMNSWQGGRQDDKSARRVRHQRENGEHGRIVSWRQSPRDRSISFWPSEVLSGRNYANA